MWNWFNCFISGRHEYGVWCEPGTIFLRCVHCGRRSPGWSVEAKPHTAGVRGTRARIAPPTAPVAQAARVVPFERQAAR
jgi:hypothetical protein